MKKRRQAEAAVVRPPENAMATPLDRDPRETPAETVARETLAKIKAAEDAARGKGTQ